jgi:hypothetical protein
MSLLLPVQKRCRKDLHLMVVAQMPDTFTRMEAEFKNIVQMSVYMCNDHIYLNCNAYEHVYIV